MSLPEHLETYLGEIETGWPDDADGNPQPFTIARFAHGGEPGTTSFATLGLARRPLPAGPDDDKAIFHELLMIVPDSLREGPLPGLLQQVGNEAIEARQAYLRGQVIGPRGTLADVFRKPLSL
jgi:hypothetical protein